VALVISNPYSILVVPTDDYAAVYCYFVGLTKTIKKCLSYHFWCSKTKTCLFKLIRLKILRKKVI